MSNRHVNGVPVGAVLQKLEDNPDWVQRISFRKVNPELSIVEPDPEWPGQFEAFKSRILAAFGISGVSEGDHKQGSESVSNAVTILSVNHVGSTSVPGLPAKAVIDIDLVLSSNSLASESFYVPRLEAAGFQYLLREPEWYEHRFFYAWEPMLCNLHVWGPRCAEAERHRIFRDWLREQKDDRDLYATIKRECALASLEKGENMMDYTRRKESVIREILNRAYIKLGYLSE
ncbi:hypothetical protein MBLNU457_3409t1 [Dothideomycetes sp. NU457]